MSAAIAGMVIGGIIYGYVQTAGPGRMGGLFPSRALFALAQQRIEQTRGAVWDPQSNPSVDQLTAANFPVITNVLDMPVSGTNNLSRHRHHDHHHLCLPTPRVCAAFRWM